MYLECVKESYASKVSEVKPLQEVEPADKD